MAYRPTERTEARRAQTRERIVAAAHALIAHGGYREASVAAVATRAGVATGSVYRHFGSKAELFAEVFRRASQREVDAVAAAAASARGPADPIGSRVAVETFARRALRGRRLAWALHRRAGRPGRGGRAPASSAPPTAMPFAARLRDGVAARRAARQDVELTAAALVGAIAEALVGPISPTAAPRATRTRSSPGSSPSACASVTDRSRSPRHVRLDAA